MSWASLTISAATIEGKAYQTFYDADLNAVDTGAITDDMLAGAKARIQTDVLARIPAVVKKLGGVTAFFDAAEGEAELSDLLQELLLFGVLEVYYGENRMADDGIFARDMQRSGSRYDVSLAAFCAYAPMQLVDEDDPPTVRRAHSRVTSATANYGGGYG
jgi:hypothetical protein